MCAPQPQRKFGAIATFTADEFCDQQIVMWTQRRARVFTTTYALRLLALRGRQHLYRLRSSLPSRAPTTAEPDLEARQPGSREHQSYAADLSGWIERQRSSHQALSALLLTTRWSAPRPKPVRAFEFLAQLLKVVVKIIWYWNATIFYRRSLLERPKEYCSIVKIDLRSC